MNRISIHSFCLSLGKRGGVGIVLRSFMAKIRENKLFVGLYYAVVVALLSVGVLVAFSALPIKGNYAIKTVRSGSMAPAINTGSIVVVKPADSYQEGEMITFKGGKSVDVTHRIVEIKEAGGNISYVTKGDANNAADTRAVLQKDVVGKVTLTVPYVGYAVSVAQTPYGFIGLLVIPALVIIYGEATNIWREVKTTRKSKVVNKETA